MRRASRRRPGRLGLIVLAVFVALLAGAGAATIKTLRFVSSVSTADLGDNIRSIVTTAPTVEPTVASASPAPPKMAGRINVLLLGYGGAGHDGAYLTDSIMVLSFDQQSKKAAMISIPRDIWVKIPMLGDQGSFSKINAAYAIGIDDDNFPNKKPEYKGPAGGGNLAAATVGGILGLKIDYWVAVDFRAFRNVVDALGGVDVNVDKAFTDYYYPRNDDASVDPGWMVVHFDAGLQHMNGERAIEYARSRHSVEDGSDFARSRRQQQLLLAIKDKALSPLGITKLFGLMDALAADFRTDMNIGQIRALADLARGVDPTTIERVSVDDSNYLAEAVSADGQDVLVPRNKTWLPLRSYIAGLLLDPAIKAENAVIQLWNGSGATGAAGAATAMLRDLGLQTLPPQNLETASPQQNELHDFTQGRDTSTVNYLASLFGARVINDTPSSTDRADIKIVLGRDYQLPTSVVDAYDPGIRAPGAGPAVEAPRPAQSPAAAAPALSSAAPAPASLSPEKLATAVAATVPVPSRPASAPPSSAPPSSAPPSPAPSAPAAAAKPALTPTPAVPARTTPTPVRR